LGAANTLQRAFYHEQKLGWSLTQIGRVFAKCGREINQVVLFVKKDFADVLRNRKLSDLLALAHAFAVITNCFGLVLQINANARLIVIGRTYG
jgi:hypothetical protein